MDVKVADIIQKLDSIAASVKVSPQVLSLLAAMKATYETKNIDIIDDQNPEAKQAIDTINKIYFQVCGN